MAGEVQILKGDCLKVLNRIERTPQRFDLVYVDPPFNAGTARGARGQSGERANGSVAYEDAWGGIDGFLCMLEPRLLAIKQVMNPVSSLWLHLDHRAVHDAKVLADRIFGRHRFRGEVIWVPGNGARGRKAPSVTHQTILIYSLGQQMIWNVDDPALREPFAETSLRTHFRHVDHAGRQYRLRTIRGKQYKYYAHQGRQLGSVWTDCPAMKANTPLCAEATGYPTQKPRELLERIVLAASRPDSLVLDPMCGSGTTPYVAGMLGRNAIGIDQSPVALKIARRRIRSLSARSS